MHPLTQLRLNGVKRRTHALRHGPAANDKIAPGVRRAVVREPQKRERLRLSFTALLPISLRVPTKLDQPRLLRMEFQRKARQPFLKLSQEPLRIFTLLKADHQIISVADNHDVAACSLPAPCLDPEVKGIVQIHVRQKR